MSAVEELKAKGNDCYKNGEIDDAINNWSSAISIVENNDNDKNILKVLYSNRSSAYLKLKNKEKALDDANKCINLDNTWIKGFIRKGDVLHAMGKYIEAYNAYNEGNRIDSNDNSIKQKMETMMNLIARSSEQQSRSSSSSSGEIYTQAPGFMGKIQTYCRILIIISFIVSMLPLSFLIDRRIISLIWRTFVFSGITNNFLSIVIKHGMPKFNSTYMQTYMQKLVPETSTSLILMGFLLLSCPKMYIFGSLPIVIHEVNFFAGYIIPTFITMVQQQKAQLTSMMRQYMPSASNMDPEDLVRGLNKTTFIAQTNRLSAYSEVIQGIYLIIEVFLPSRNLLLVFLWWQFLKVRFILDQTGNIRWAFSDVDRNILILMSHKMCPSLVNKGYILIKSYLEKQISDVQNAATRTSGTTGSSSFMDRMKSNCTIM